MLKNFIRESGSGRHLFTNDYRYLTGSDYAVGISPEGGLSSPGEDRDIPVWFSKEVKVSRMRW